MWTWGVPGVRSPHIPYIHTLFTGSLGGQIRPQHGSPAAFAAIEFVPQRSSFKINRVFNWEQAFTALHVKF